MPVAPEVPPVTVSPVINFCCDVIKSLGLVLDKSSTRTLAVALEVPPVIVSPTINFSVDLKLGEYSDISLFDYANRLDIPGDQCLLKNFKIFESFLET